MASAFEFMATAFFMLCGTVFWVVNIIIVVLLLGSIIVPIATAIQERKS